MAKKFVSEEQRAEIVEVREVLAQGLDRVVALHKVMVAAYDGPKHTECFSDFSAKTNAFIEILRRWQSIDSQR